MTVQANILVIDDDESVRESLGDILEYYGFNVMMAATGLAGIDIFEQACGNIHLVILDLLMPNVSGPETLKLIRKISPATEVILSSGYDQDEVIQRLETAIQDRSHLHFLQKPYSMSTVLSVVRQVLGEDSDRSTNREAGHR